MAVVAGTDNADTIFGTNGDDNIFGLAQFDVINCGGGFDIAAYWTSPFAISVRLFEGIVDNDGFGGRDTLIGIEGVAGMAFNDFIVGTDLGNYFQGFGGDDTIVALGGDEIVRAGEGDDYVDGGTGTDRVFLIGNRADHTITAIPGGFRIVDNVPNRYGTNTILDFELFQFADTQLTAAELLDPNARGDGLPYPRPERPVAPPPEPAERPFSAWEYLASHGDLVAAFGADDTVGARHYIRFGRAEGRADTFDPASYIAKYADLRSAFGSDLEAATRHFITAGFAEGRSDDLI